MENREIKFRAWDIYKECFIPNDFWAVITTDFGAFGIMLKDWENYKEGEYFYPNSQILQQFTGLKDKNGQDIYEGDILKSSKNDFYINGDKADVYFLNGSFCISILYDTIPVQLYDCEKVYKSTEYPNNIDKCDWIEEFEIIGNIYENPNLL